MASIRHSIRYLLQASNMNIFAGIAKVNISTRVRKVLILL